MFEWPGDLSVDDRCHCCQFPAPLRPHVVWFGEMPLGMDDIYRALSKADFFVAIGTSGHVYPAAGFVHEARLGGAYAMELNTNRAKWRASSTRNTTVLPAKWCRVLCTSSRWARWRGPTGLSGAFGDEKLRCKLNYT